MRAERLLMVQSLMQVLTKFEQQVECLQSAVYDYCHSERF